MRIELMEFQVAALAQIRPLVKAMRREASEIPQVLSFSAPTGSGKTIISTALFEQIFFGADGFVAQPDAVVLWVSDMPELNLQTRMKIEAKSDRIKVNRLLTIDEHFDAECLTPGTIHFINTQKLGRDKKLATMGNARQHSIWETFANTARKIPDRFYVVIDEAHRGARSPTSTNEANSIMQRFIFGDSAVGMIPMPMVLGISATPQRFQALMTQSTQHTLRKCDIPPSSVRGSGLLKDRLLIDLPQSSGLAEATMLKRAVEKWKDMTNRWEHYCIQAKEPRVVRPILIVQVADGTDSQATTTDIGGVISTIEASLNRALSDKEIVHTFESDLLASANGRKIRKIEPARIEQDPDASVVFFKQNLSTGWDCPRAEVMVSYRSANDYTYIGQLIGRMVRTPLAKQIESDSALNDVHLYLPRFDIENVKRVVSFLQNDEDTPHAPEVGSSAELVTLDRDPQFAHVFDFLVKLSCYRVDPTRATGGLSRIMALARLLDGDEFEKDALKDVTSIFVGRIQDEIVRLRTSGLYDDLMKKSRTLAITTVGVDHLTGEIGEEVKITTDLAQRDIEEMFERVGRQLTNGLHNTWWRSQEERDAEEVMLELIMTCQSSDLMAQLEADAIAKFDELFDKHKRSISELPESQRSRYKKVRLASKDPVLVEWALPENIPHKRSVDAPKLPNQLFRESDGTFGADLGTWERETLDKLLERSDLVAWLRNGVKKAWSFELPFHVSGEQEQRPMFPDFVVVRMQNDKLTCDLLEPHDPSRNDNIDKAKGLARFADRHGEKFGRIGLIRKIRVSAGMNALRMLDVNRSLVRKSVSMVDNDAALEELFRTNGEDV